MQPQDNTSLGSALARVFWMVIGPLALYAFLVAIVNAGTGWLNAADIAFLTVLLAMIFARWYEFHRGNARTSTGAPAGPQHFRRYVYSALAIGLGAWLVANLFANFSQSA